MIRISSSGSIKHLSLIAESEKETLGKIGIPVKRCECLPFTKACQFETNFAIYKHRISPFCSFVRLIIVTNSKDCVLYRRRPLKVFPECSRPESKSKSRKTNTCLPSEKVFHVFISRGFSFRYEYSRESVSCVRSNREEKSWDLSSYGSRVVG